MIDETSRADPTRAVQAVPLFWWTAAIALAFLVAQHYARVGGDAFLYIAHGRTMLDHGEVPAFDPFSEMTRQAPLVLHMVLPMLGFAWLDDHLGLASVVLLAALGGTAALVGFLLPAGRSAAATLAGTGLLGALLLVDREFFEARGQMFAYLLFVPWQWACLRVLRGERVPLALLALVPIVWANTHPSFLIAAVLPLLFAVVLLVEPARARAGRLLPLVGLALWAVAASCISPYGPGLVVDALGLVGDNTTQRISHMRTPPLTLGWTLLLALLASLTLARALLGPSRHRRLHVVVGVAWLAMTLIARRYAPFAVAWTIAMLPLILERVPFEARWLRRVLRGSALAFVLAMPFVPPPFDLDRHLPTAATAVVQTLRLPPRMLNEFGWGGYLMYAFGEERRVFIDGRNNLYGNGVFDDYLQMTFAAPSLDMLLDVYGVNTVFWTSGWPLDRALVARPDRWREVYRDDKAVIHVRR